MSKPKVKLLAIRLDESLARDFKKICGMIESPQTKLVREWIEKFVNENQSIIGKKK